ncbi:MAG: hypothetical protein HYW48_09260 [Deltaproteobacteria bacterium]|nr:hypothetical protein [Deltaproteobacteria bacterium]
MDDVTKYLGLASSASFAAIVLIILLLDVRAMRSDLETHERLLREILDTVQERCSSTHNVGTLGENTWKAHSSTKSK